MDIIWFCIQGPKRWRSVENRVWSASAFLHGSISVFVVVYADLLPALDGDAKTMTFLQEVVDILLAYIVESFDRETKVIDFHYPNELLQLNNWELQHEPATLDDILISCRATLKYAIKTGKFRLFCDKTFVIIFGKSKSCLNLPPEKSLKK